MGRDACCDVVNRGVALYRGPRLRRHPRRPPGRPRRGHGTGRVGGADRRSHEALHDHRRAARREGQGHHRQRRRRARRARLRVGLRRARRARSSGASTPCPATRRSPSSRPPSSAPRRPGPASGGRSAAAARSGTRSPTTRSSTCSTSAPGTARPGAATCAAPAAATTSTSRRSSRCAPTRGELVWHYQTTPGDSWDFTSTQHMILADLEIDGRAAQGADAGAEERLLLRARPRDRRADLGAEVRGGDLGERRRPRDRAPDRDADGPLPGRRADRGEALASRRPQLAADVLQPADGPGLHPGPRDPVLLQARPGVPLPARRVEPGHRLERRRALPPRARLGPSAGLGSGGAEGGVARPVHEPVERRHPHHRREPRVPGHRPRHASRPTARPTGSSCSRRRRAPGSSRRRSPTAWTACST